MQYQYNGAFSIEDCSSKIYDEKDIFVSPKRLKTLVNLGYLKPLPITKKK